MAGATLRVALVIDRYDALGGGAQRWTHDHALRLLRAGHEVSIFARSVKGVPSGARSHLVQLAGMAWVPRRLRFAAAVEKMLDRDRFDLVHDMADGWRADIIMPHHGIRRYVYRQRSRLVHGLLRWGRPLGFWLLPRYREFRALERRQYDRSGRSTIVAVSEMVRRQLLSTYPVDPSRVVVIHNGVDLNRFRPDANATNRNRIRAQLGWQSRTIYLTVAHDFRLKGVDRILSAMAHLRGRGRHAGLIVIGGGDIPRYQRLAETLGVAGDVVFLGDQSDPVPSYHAADVFVLPTLYDPCPLVVIEALACGLPVITTNYSGATELMSLPRDGVVINDPMDITELSFAMLRFDEAEANQHAPERAIASRRPELCAERMFAKYLDLYRDSMRGRGTPVQASTQPADAPSTR